MNKIYQLMDDDDYYYVSNCIVSDIRDDINRSRTLCSLNEYGICYNEQSVLATSTKTSTTEATSTDSTTAASETSDEGEKVKRINAFDLILYPFKSYDSTSVTNYRNSFKYSKDNYEYIKQDLKESKTLAHQIKLPDEDDIVLIKNYIQLKSTLTTTYKVNKAEQSEILANVKLAIADAFNMREIDFGEEIPLDSIKDVIAGADERIKNVYITTSDIITKIEDGSGIEYWTGMTDTSRGQTSIARAKTLSNKLILRNILAGRVALFDYDTSFKADFNESDVEVIGAKNVQYDKDKGDKQSILFLEPRLVLELTDKGGDGSSSGEKESRNLHANEVIQFRAPNYVTKMTYPAYVNYFIHLENSGEDADAIPANFVTLREFIGEYNEATLGYDKGYYPYADAEGKTYTIKYTWQRFMDWVAENYPQAIDSALTAEEGSKDAFNNKIKYFGALFTRSESEGKYTYTIATE